MKRPKLSEVSAIPDLKILDRATIPQKPSSNSAPKIIFMAFAASLGLAVALALLLDQFDKRFRYPEQVTDELGLSILGAVPAIRKHGHKAQWRTQEASQVVEAFRSIRLNLVHSYGVAVRRCRPSRAPALEKESHSFPPTLRCRLRKRATRRCSWMGTFVAGSCTGCSTSTGVPA